MRRSSFISAGLAGPCGPALWPPRETTHTTNNNNNNNNNDNDNTTPASKQRQRAIRASAFLGSAVAACRELRGRRPL